MGVVDTVKNAFTRKKKQLPEGPPPPPDMGEIPREEYVIINKTPMKRINKAKLRDHLSVKQINQLLKQRREELRKQKAKEDDGNDQR